MRRRTINSFEEKLNGPSYQRIAFLRHLEISFPDTKPEEVLRLDRRH